MEEKTNWTPEWFEQNFFDIRQHKPKKGQVLAQYRAVAHFVDGWVKQNIIGILKTNKVGAETAQKVMHNMVGADHLDGLQVLLDMAKDIQNGMTDDEALKKEYRMVIEYNYWTEKDNVPKGDPHWSTIDILNTEDIDDKVKFTYTAPD